MTTTNFRKFFIGIFIFLTFSQSHAQPMLRDGQKILFVGNSNVGSEGGLHHHFRRTLRRMKQPINVETDWIAMYGSPTLASMLTEELRERIENGDDDIVVVQSGAIDELKTFAKLIEGNNKKMVVFGTWPGNPFLSGNSFKSFSNQISNQYEQLKEFEKEHNIPVAPCGLAFHYLLSQKPEKGDFRDDFLFTPEGPVQNDLGSMVNVSMLYSTMSSKSPIGLPMWNPFPENMVNQIQSQTYSAYKEWRKDKIVLRPFKSKHYVPSANEIDLNQKPIWKSLVQPDTKIYYVGNSYIGTEGGLENHFPRLLREVNSPYKPSTRSQIFWGQGLQRMFTEGVKNQIRNGEEELVVVTSGPKVYLDSFYNEINAAKKQMVIHMTWGRNPSIQGMEVFKEGTQKIVEAVRTFEEETGVPVVPCGLIFYDLIINPPVLKDVKLRQDWVFMEENIHQNHLGTMVNAAAHYAVLTGQSPVGLPMWDPYPKELVKILQERVWTIVQKWKKGEAVIE